MNDAVDRPLLLANHLYEFGRRFQVRQAGLIDSLLDRADIAIQPDQDGATAALAHLLRHCLSDSTPVLGDEENAIRRELDRSMRNWRRIHCHQRGPRNRLSRSVEVPAFRDALIR